jgi:hypothetical protein
VIPVSEIERVIHDYEIRMAAVSKIMAETRDVETLLRCAGKHEAYVVIVIDLKELIPSEQVPSQKSDSN